MSTASTNFPSLDHIGIAVEDAEKAAALYEVLIGSSPYRQEEVGQEGVRTHFIPAGSAKLELLEATGDDSPIRTYLDRRGEGIHHVAFEVADIRETFRRLKNEGFEPVSDEPKAGAEDKMIFFLHPKDTGGVLVEFCQSMPPELERVIVDTPSGAVATFTEGSRDNPPLVVMHGIAGSVQIETAPLARRLAEHFFVIAPDFSGHGASADPDGRGHSFDLYADNVIAALDYFDIERTSLFGFSMGGAVGLRTAHDHPERVDRVAAHATYVYWDEKRAGEMALRLDPQEIIESNGRAAERLAAAHGPEQWEDRFAALREFAATLPHKAPTDDELARVKHPVFISAADRDPFFEIEGSIRLQRHLPEARLVILPGERHSLRAVDMDVLVRLLTRFFLGQPSEDE